jgi:hypothetical protein
LLESIGLKTVCRVHAELTVSRHSFCGLVRKCRLAGFSAPNQSGRHFERTTSCVWPAPPFGDRRLYFTFSVNHELGLAPEVRDKLLNAWGIDAGVGVGDFTRKQSALPGLPSKQRLQEGIVVAIYVRSSRDGLVGTIPLALAEAIDQLGRLSLPAPA